ncbi:hypothetical protein ACOME3_003133 [Neoechinorhynchus agilis]
MNTSVRKYKDWVSNGSSDDVVFSLPIMASPKVTSFNGKNTVQKVSETKRKHHKSHRHKRHKSAPPTIVLERHLSELIGPQKKKSAFLTPDEVDQINGPLLNNECLNDANLSQSALRSMGRTIANGADFIALADGSVVPASNVAMPSSDLVVNVDNAKTEEERITAVEGEPVRIVARPIFLPRSTKTGSSVRLLDSHSSKQRWTDARDGIDSDEDDEFPKWGRGFYNCVPPGFNFGSPAIINPYVGAQYKQPIQLQTVQLPASGPGAFTGLASYGPTGIPGASWELPNASLDIISIPLGKQPIIFPPVHVNPIMNQSGQVVYTPTGYSGQFGEPRLYPGSIYPTTTPTVPPNLQPLIGQPTQHRPIPTTTTLPIAPPPSSLPQVAQAPVITQPHGTPGIATTLEQPTAFRGALMNVSDW